MSGYVHLKKKKKPSETLNKMNEETKLVTRT